MKLAYDGYDRAGRAVSGVVEAADAAEGAELLRKRGVFALRLDEPREGGPAPASRGRRPQQRDVAGLLRQLAVLVATRTTIVDALEAVECQTEPGAWRDTIAGLRRRVEEGQSLAEAMRSYPRVFDAVCVSLVAAGEGSGRLDVMLERLAAVKKRQLQTRSLVMGALLYPVILVGISGGVLGVMLGFVLPRFEGLFETLGVALPPSTRVLMHVSALLRANWTWLAAVAVLGVGCVWAWATTAAGRRTLDGLLLRLPVVGGVMRGLATARVARVLGVLLEGRVGMLEALRLARDASGSRSYGALLERAAEAVSRGEGLASSLRGDRLIAPAVCAAIASGERSGQLPQVLDQVASFLEDDNEVLVRSLTSVLEPLIVVGLGTVVGAVATSMFLPLFDLAGAAGGAP